LPIHTADLSFEIGDTGRYAKGYHKKNSFSGALLGLFIDKSKFMGKPEGKWRPFKFNYVNGASYGGLIGTPNAFVSYIQELLKPDSKLISGRCKKLMFTENITNTGKTTGMCLAWFKGKLNGYNYFTHAGGGGGYCCEIRIYPELNLGSVIMFNRTGMKDDRFLNQLDKYILPPVQQ
jgi:CubicO group peptidase (beta-lactamase class C family)